MNFRDIFKLFFHVLKIKQSISKNVKMKNEVITSVIHIFINKRLTSAKKMRKTKCQVLNQLHKHFLLVSSSRKRDVHFSKTSKKCYLHKIQGFQ